MLKSLACFINKFKCKHKCMYIMQTILNVSKTINKIDILITIKLVTEITRFIICLVKDRRCTKLCWLAVPKFSNIEYNNSVLLTVRLSNKIKEWWRIKLRLYETAEDSTKLTKCYQPRKKSVKLGISTIPVRWGIWYDKTIALGCFLVKLLY